MADYGTNSIQSGDVLFFSTDDGGEISLVDGADVAATGRPPTFIEMTQGLETMSYLILMGGNQDDDGSESTANLQWWGNEDEPPEMKYRSRFQTLLNGVPLTSQTLLDLEKAAQEQLDEGLVTAGYAESVLVSAYMPSNKRVDITAQITLTGGDVIPINLSFQAGAAA